MHVRRAYMHVRTCHVQIASCRLTVSRSIQRNISMYPKMRPCASEKWQPSTAFAKSCFSIFFVSSVASFFNITRSITIPPSSRSRICGTITVVLRDG
jgi:hypothetical protein